MVVALYSIGIDTFDAAISSLESRFYVARVIVSEYVFTVVNLTPNNLRQFNFDDTEITRVLEEAYMEKQSTEISFWDMIKWVLMGMFVVAFLVMIATDLRVKG